MDDRECPGETECSSRKGNPIHTELVQITGSVGELQRLSKDPPREMVDRICKGCDLLPTKPGVEHYPAPLLAAANDVAFMERLIKAGITYNIDTLSARRAHALVGMVSGRERSEHERVKKSSSSTQQPTQERSKQLMKGGEGVMDD